MNTDERRARIMAALTQEPQCTSELKERAGLRGHVDQVYKILKSAERRGELKFHGKNERGECVWSLPANIE